MSMEFREFIRKRRKELDISQAKLADRLALYGYPTTDKRVSHWESGRNRPPLYDTNFRVALAAALELSVTEMLEILGYGTELLEISEEAQIAAQIVDRLSAEDKKRAILATTARFSLETARLADRLGVRLISGAELGRMRAMAHTKLEQQAKRSRLESA